MTNNTDFFLGKSRCQNGYLHRYEIFEEFPNAVVEICYICRNKKIFKIVNNRIDNLEYLKHHIRETLTPYHPLFWHEYKYHPYE